jgi:hypothetical protein
MYTIEKMPYGMKLTFGGFIDAQEMKKWNDELATILSRFSSKFNVLVDMRTLKPLPPESQEIMVTGQAACKKKGMERSCVVLDNTTTTIQFKRLGKESGIYNYERYIDASANPAWEQTAIKWLKDSVDPDK